MLLLVSPAIAWRCCPVAARAESSGGPAEELGQPGPCPALWSLQKEESVACDSSGACQSPQRPARSRGVGCLPRLSLERAVRNLGPLLPTVVPDSWVDYGSGMVGCPGPESRRCHFLWVSFLSFIDKVTKSCHLGDADTCPAKPSPAPALRQSLQPMSPLLVKFRSNQRNRLFEEETCT